MPFLTTNRLIKNTVMIIINLICVIIITACQKTNPPNDSDDPPDDPMFYETEFLGVIFKDNGGYLHYSVDKIEHMDYFCGVYSELADFCGEKGINLLYVQAPNKNLKGYTEFPEGAYNYSNENADNFLSGLAAKGLPYLDLRDEIIKQDLERSELFYKTDHHWTTTAAFWGAARTAEELNRLFSFDLGPDKFYSDINNYTLSTKKETFIGSQGQHVNRKYVTPDDYTLITPNFDTDFEVWMKEPEGEPDFKGSFYDTIVKDYIVFAEDLVANRHASYFGSDYPFCYIKNNNNSGGKKILLVKDSFALPYGAFLSLYSGELIMVDMRGLAETGLSLYSCIEKYNPDAVVFLYNTEAFDTVMFNINK